MFRRPDHTNRVPSARGRARSAAGEARARDRRQRGIETLAVARCRDVLPHHHVRPKRLRYQRRTAPPTGTWVRRGNGEGLPRSPYSRSTCTYARKHLRNRSLATALRRRANDNEPSRRVLGRGTSYRPQPARRSSDPASAQPLDAPERRHRRRRPVAAISLPTMQRPRKGSPTSTNSPTTPSVGKARQRGRAPAFSLLTFDLHLCLQTPPTPTACDSSTSTSR